MEKSTPPLLVILGPTASGKSALAVFLAQQLNGEIISADSRQVYRGLDIGSGKMTSNEMGGIPHHLLDVADPHLIYTVTDYVRDARTAIDLILSHDKLPILVGGTGLYIDTLVDNASIPAVSKNQTLRDTLESKTPDELFSLLKEKDPARAATIDPKNPRRLVRALEIADALGAVPPLAPSQSPYNATCIGIQLPAPKLQTKIKERLVQRLKNGLIEEVSRLHDADGLSWERLDALGLEYRYVARYLQGAMAEEEMTLQLYKAICDYAKRQMTWFKRRKEIEWVETMEQALEIAKKAGL